MSDPRPASTAAAESSAGASADNVASNDDAAASRSASRRDFAAAILAVAIPAIAIAATRGQSTPFPRSLALPRPAGAGVNTGPRARRPRQRPLNPTRGIPASPKAGAGAGAKAGADAPNPRDIKPARRIATPDANPARNPKGRNADRTPAPRGDATPAAS